MARARQDKLIVSFNGRIVSPSAAKISALDRGALIGYGVFDTLLVLDNTPLWLRDHVARFDRARQALGMRKLFGQPQIISFVEKAVRAHKAPLKKVRITQSGGTGSMWGGGASAGGSDGALWIIVAEHSWRFGNSVRASLVKTEPVAPWLREIKSTSRLPYLPPETDESATDGVTEKILLVPRQGVIEFTNANLLLRRDDELLAPPAGAAYPGLTLKKTLAALEKSGRKVNRLKVSLDDLLNADEIIGLNSLRLAFSVGELAYQAGDGSHRRRKYGSHNLAREIRSLALPKKYRSLIG
ncbi:MAG: aminotransferase class IV [Candidatus Zixiibacteriota bacterium]